MRVKAISDPGIAKQEIEHLKMYLTTLTLESEGHCLLTLRSSPVNKTKNSFVLGTSWFHQKQDTNSSEKHIELAQFDKDEMSGLNQNVQVLCPFFDQSKK